MYVCIYVGMQVLKIGALQMQIVKMLQDISSVIPYGMENMVWRRTCEQTDSLYLFPLNLD